VAAGAIGRKILRDFYQVEVVSWVSQVHKIRMEMEQKPWTRQEVDANLVRCPHLASAEKMQSEIEQMQRMGDSVGGVISARISNPPPGLGSPVFDRFEADLAKAMLSIPATKGFEIGSGFAGVEMTGSEHNDIFIPKKKYKGEPQIGTQTNNSGGVQGGITNGEDVFFRVAFKPTATIFKEMDTVNQAGKPMKIKPKGRHDTCVLPRAVPIVDAMACLVTLDHILAMEAYHRFGPQISAQRKAKKIN
jgi:chorismate synthase